MKKFLSSLFILILAVVVFVAVGKDWILKTAIEQGVTRITGFHTEVASLKFNFPSTIHIQGLKIENPSSFKEKTFVDIPEIYVSVVLDEVLKGKRIHLPEVRLNIQEVNLEKNEKGISNVELLSSIGGGGAAKQNAPATGSKKEQKQLSMPFLLEKLVLTIRTVSYDDRSGLVGAVPIPGKKLKIDLNVEQQVFENITDPNALVNLILAKVLNSATLGRLMNIDPQALIGDSLSGVKNAGTELIGKSSEYAAKGIEDVTSQAKNLADKTEVTRKAEALLGTTAGKTTEALGDAAGAAKHQVSGLLGKLKSAASSEEKSETTTTS